MSSDCQYCTYPAEGEYRCDSAKPYMCGPCQKLLELDQKIGEIRALLASLKNERQIRKEEANHYHDRPFDSTHCLPPEILADVFMNCRPPAPLVLSAVCQRWRTIANSTPHLWKTLPIHISTITDLYSSSLKPLLIEEWIDRAGELPLSIDLSVFDPDHRAKDDVIQIINVLNRFSKRWLQLCYAGPSSLLSYFPSDEQDYPQLRTLTLETPDSFMDSEPRWFRGTVNLHPKRLNTLTIFRIMVVSLNFDWHYLTRLELNYVSLPDCFEAFRRAPYLTHCTFSWLREADLEQNDFPLPQNPIVHLELQYLKFLMPGSLHKNIFRLLSCPSLKTLELECIEREYRGSMPLVVEFLRRSECSLERLWLRESLASSTDVASLCHGIPTLQHLHTEFLGHKPLEFELPTILFGLLGEVSTVNGRKEPRYLPDLRSLTSYQPTFSTLTTLPNIFATSASHSMEHHRHALKSVMVFVSGLPSPGRGSVDEVDEETVKKLLRLREAGVKLEIQAMRIGKDMIDLAIERYYGVGRM